MEFNQYDHLVEATNDLTRKGYKASFKFTDEGEMQCLKNKKTYTPQEMKIIESHRFEGMTNPADMSIVFAVECEDGTKGMIVSGYGTYANAGFEKFMTDVERDPECVESPYQNPDSKVA